jgi:hypothetical protein
MMESKPPFLQVDGDGASSNEDFWMFFAFAQLILVFVLMGFVNYLGTLETETVSPDSAQTDLPQQDPTQQRELSIHVIADGSPAQYRLNGDGVPVGLADLSAELLAALPEYGGAPVVNVVASGDVIYRDVFNAAYAARAAADETQQVVIRQVYEYRSDNTGMNLSSTIKEM